MFDDPKMLVLAGGVRLAAYSKGGSGPPIIFCHGFPELAFTWRHVMPAIAAAGYRTAALDMRGYGRSDQPKLIEDYDIAKLTGDLAGAAQALGFDRAVFVGHDWGSSVVWEMPLLQPQVTAGVVALNTPRWKYRRWGDYPTQHLRDQHGPEHYMLLFQEPGLADVGLVGDGDFEAAADLRHRRPAFEMFPIDPDSDLAHQRLSGIVAAPLGEACLSPEEAAYYGQAFRRTGYTGGLNWYRNLDRNAQLLKNSPMTIDVPALMIAATHDIFNPESASLGLEDLGPDVERVVLPESGHWMPDENRADLPATIIDWLDRHRKALWG